MPIRFRLAEVMDAKGITGYALAQRTGMTPSAIYKLARQSHMQRLNGETLARLCDALECTPGELLEYEPAKKKRAH